MKHNMQKYLQSYIAEGLTHGLSETDKELMLLSMNLSNDVTRGILDAMTDFGDAIEKLELEEDELLQNTQTVINSIIQSLTPAALERIQLLSYERYKAVAGKVAADKMLAHDKKTTRKMLSNLKKMLSDSKYRIAVAKKCHLIIVK
jgi:hypothetical protein